MPGAMNARGQLELDSESEDANSSPVTATTLRKRMVGFISPLLRRNPSAKMYAATPHMAVVMGV